MLLLGIGMIVGVTFAADIIVPLGRNQWLTYFLALALGVASQRAWLPFAVFGTILVAVTLGWFIGPEGVQRSLAALNRGIAAAVMLILPFAGNLMIRNHQRLTEHDWEQRSEVRLSQELQDDLDAEEIAARSLAVLAEALDARAAVFLVREGDGLSRIAGWGLDEETHDDGRHGHLLRTIRERRAITIEAPRDGGMGWRSGLLRGKAIHGIIIPTRTDHEVNGVIEIGLDYPPHQGAAHLLEQLGERIGNHLRSALYRNELQPLLEETRRQAEQLHSHSQELAATNEELEEQTRALQESESRLREQQAELEEQNAQLEAQTVQLEEQRGALARSRRQLADQTEELACESRYKSEFVANMSHELRTPLNALLIMARLLAENRKGNLNHEQVHWPETIKSSGKDLLALINDILDIARVEAGKIDIDPAPVAPAAIASRLKRSFDPQARECGLTLDIDVAPNLPEVITDAARVEQILRNFPSNALKSI